MHRDPGQQDLLGVNLRLDAKPAANVGGDDAHLRLADAQAFGDGGSDKVGDLGRGPDHYASLVVGHGHHAAALDRRGRDSRMRHLTLDDEAGLFERSVHIAVRAVGQVEEVLRHRFVDERRALRECVLERDDRRQGVDLGLEQLDGVGSLVTAACDDRGHHLACETNAIAGQYWPLRRHGARGRQVDGKLSARDFEVGRREHGADAGGGLGG